MVRAMKIPLEQRRALGVAGKVGDRAGAVEEKVVRRRKQKKHKLSKALDREAGNYQ